MAEEVYNSEPVFRRELDHCLARLAVVADLDARAVLFPSQSFAAEAEKRIIEPPYFLGLVFAVDYSLAKLWMSWGVEPAMVLGHSAGEYVAACLAGVFSLDDALRLVVLRGRLHETLPPASMLTVALSEEELMPLVAHADVDIALVNGPSACVVAGDNAAIERLEAELRARQVDTRRIAVAGASHCRLVEPILPAFSEALAKITMQPPQIPYVSALTGKLASAEVATPGYWTEHLRRTVRFAAALATALSDTDRVLLEVGPGAALTSLARQVAASQGAVERVIVPSLRRPADKDSDADVLARAVARLWSASAGVNAGSYHSGERRRRGDAPRYPFARDKHWIEIDPSIAGFFGGGEQSRSGHANSVEPGSESDRTVHLASGRAPQTETERELAAIWRTVLGVEVSDVDASFFELGGSSLSGLRLKRLLDEKFNVNLPVGSMQPTLGVMAAWVDSTLGRSAVVPDAAERAAAAQEEGLVDVRSGDKGVPLFIVHGAGGEVCDFHSRSGRQQNRRPVVAIRDFVSGSAEAPRDVAEQARLYVTTMRKRQPQGPFLLGGHSYGGLVALEMARQLVAAGERVLSVVLLDAADIAGLAVADGDVQRFIAQRVGANIDTFTSLEQTQTPGELERGSSDGDSIVSRIQRTAEANIERATRHPLTAIDVPVAFFRARDRRGIGVDRPELAFIAVANDAFHLQIVEGDHWTMLHSPNAVPLWNRIDEVLDAAIAPESRAS